MVSAEFSQSKKPSKTVHKISSLLCADDAFPFAFNLLVRLSERYEFMGFIHLSRVRRYKTFMNLFCSLFFKDFTQFRISSDACSHYQ